MAYVKLTTDSPSMKAPGSPHVTLTCENHPDLLWSCKNIAVGPDANGDIRYNGTRNIFFDHDSGKGECDCPSSKLIGIEPVPEREARLEAKYAYLKTGAQA